MIRGAILGALLSSAFGAVVLALTAYLPLTPKWEGAEAVNMAKFVFWTMATVLCALAWIVSKMGERK